MEFVRLENINSQEFKEAWKIYENSFPPDERRTLPAQEKLMNTENYFFFGILMKNALVAIIATWNFKIFSFVEHLAVRQDLQGKEIGTQVLKKYLLKAKRKVVLEVEKSETEIAVKRINFYKKSGFELNPFDYVQPSYGHGKKPVPALLMTYPRAITEKEFSSIKQILYVHVYRLNNVN